jgi:hypothetical protein
MNDVVETARHVRLLSLSSLPSRGNAARPRNPSYEKDGRASQAND